MRGEEWCRGKLTPPEVAFCGPEFCWVPYADPGGGLARALPSAVERFREERGWLTRMILAQNHGMVTWGATVAEVLSVTLMALKTAQVLLGTMLLGGPRFLTPEEVDRIAPRKQLEGWEE